MKFEELYNKILSESHLEFLYHGLGWDALYNILKENTIKLGFSQSANAINNEYPFYLSASRNNKTKYTTHCTLVLDGRKIGNNNKIKSYDYWGSSFHSVPGYRDEEMEERIFSNDPTLYPANKYISSIHVMVYKDAPHSFKYYLESDRLAKELDIPIYFYTNEQAYKQLRTSYASDSFENVIQTNALDMDDKTIHDRREYRAKYYQTMVDIYNNKIDEKSPDLHEVEKDIDRYLPYHEDDMITNIMDDLRNISHGEFKQLISNIIRQNKLTHNDENIKKAISIIIKKIKRNLL